MDVKILRDLSSHIPSFIINGNRNWSSFRKDRIYVFTKRFEKVGRRADGWVAGEGDFGMGGEDVDFAGGRIGVRRWEVQEDDLGEIEFAGNGLFLGLCEGGGERGRDTNDSDRIPGIACGSENVESFEGEVHFEGWVGCCEVEIWG